MNDFDEFDAFEGAPLSARAMSARSGPTPYLDELNPAQREAVEALDGPVLMLAGAGTGKTKALTTRIAHLLNTGRASPNEILSVTFTNKAAREMKTRVGRLLGHAVEGMPWMGTFHSICVKLLRRHAELVGLKSNFTILDTDDQLRLLKQLIQAAKIDCIKFPQAGLILIVTLGAAIVVGAGLGRGHFIRCPRTVLPVVDDASQLTRRPTLVVNIGGLNQLLQ